MDANSPDTQEPKAVTRRHVLKKGLGWAAVIAGSASTIAQLSRDEAQAQQHPPAPSSAEQVEKVETTEEKIFKNFSPQEKTSFEEKIVEQIGIYKKANDYLRADRVLDWEETTLKPIFDSDKVPEKERHFWSEFLSAIVYVESEGKHYISSDREAIGLTQLTDATAKSTANKHGIFSFNLGIGWDNLRLGRFHLQDLLERFGIDISVLAYYAGFTFANQRVQAALEKRGVNAKSATDLELHSLIDQNKLNIANLGSQDGEEYLKKVVAALRILDERRKITLQTIA